MKRKWKHFTKNEINAWPQDHKACRSCLEVKHFSCFHKNNNGAQLFGLSSDCKECRKRVSKKHWEKSVKNDLEKIIYNRAKGRARKRGIYFDITPEDIVIPDKCPIFNKKLVYGDHDWTPSIDRIDSSKGYTKENIIIVSNKANVIKNNACPDDIIVVGEFYKNIASYTTA